MNEHFWFCPVASLYPLFLLFGYLLAAQEEQPGYVPEVALAAAPMDSTLKSWYFEKKYFV